MNYELVKIFEKLLSQKANLYQDGNISFWCPICKLEHHKKKLNINLSDDKKRFGKWNCWNCADKNSMKGKNLISLLIKLQASSETIEKVKKIIQSSVKINFDNLFFNKLEIKKYICLPKEFKSLAESSNSLEYKNAINYLIKDRGLVFDDIIKYNIGYCGSGKFSGRIIIPSYDKDSNLNYFVARSYYGAKPPYLNPPVPNEGLIMFEMMINWSLPVILVEGAFDAIAARRNAIPLLGQSLKVIKRKIIENNVKEIFLALDKDAIGTSIKYIEYFFQKDISVNLIKMDEKDPSKLGFKKFIELYKNSIPVSFKDLITYKLNKGWV